jgi:UDP-glucose 4-epimerase
VRDVARAFRLAVDNPFAAGHIINIGSGHSYAIEHVAQLLARAMDVPHLQPKLLTNVGAGDIRHCFADISRHANCWVSSRTICWKIRWTNSSAGSVHRARVMAVKTPNNSSRRKVFLV